MRDRCSGLAACVLLGLPLLSAGCTRTNLQAIDDVDVSLVDNLLEIEGEVCTDPPEATAFPVKILFIIDGSGSMQFVDNPTKRALAVEETILRLRSNPGVSFAVIRFNESDAVLTRPNVNNSNGCFGNCTCNCDSDGDGDCDYLDAPDPDCNGRQLSIDDDASETGLLSQSFTRDFAILQRAVQGLRVADSVTDYQGALSTAFRLLFDDMIATSSAELARTKYVVLFMSDGDPFPDCCSQRSEMEGRCSRANQLPFCSDPTLIRQNPTQLPFVIEGEDYNQPYQIYASVRDIMDLAVTFGVGEMRLHTAFLFDPTLVTSIGANGCYSIAGVTFVCPNEARELLGTMASIGMGVFRDFSRAEEIDFLSFDFTNVKLENAIKNFVVTNTNLMPTPNGLVVDSDGDGLSDADEFEAGLNRLSRDSDDDGISDTVEEKLRRNGFDPRTPNPGCEDAADRADPDADGLVLCEELLLRSDPELPDTDADGVPDWTEVIAGTDPAVSDALGDSDLDANRNGDEIRVHTGIGFNEGSDRPSLAYRYRTTELGVGGDGGRCYAFGVKNVQLGTPLARPTEPGSYGRNDILVYMAQAPAENPSDFGSFKVACVQARYIEPDFKDPPQGKVTLQAEDFKDWETLNPSSDCVGLTPP